MTANHVDITKASEIALLAAVKLADLEDCSPDSHEQLGALVRFFYNFLIQDQQQDFSMRCFVFNQSVELVCKEIQKTGVPSYPNEFFQPTEEETGEFQNHETFCYLAQSVVHQSEILEQAVKLRLDIPTNKWPTLGALSDPASNRKAKMR